LFVAVVVGDGDGVYVPPELDDGAEYAPLIAHCSVCETQTGEWVATGNAVGNGAKSIARSMNSFQMVAGNVGPETAMP
jgi:hypothetical protein